MSDTELYALATQVQADVAGMVAMNDYRKGLGQGVAYTDDLMADTDSVRCLEAELRRRKVLVTP